MTNLDVAPTLNKWLAALGIALWLLSPVSVESGRLDPPLADAAARAAIAKAKGAAKA